MELEVEQLYGSLQEFLIVLAHAIFYVCRVYPADTFEKVRHYDAATYQNSYPGVQEWCEHAAAVTMAAVRTHKAQGVSFVVLENGQPVERVVVDMRHLPPYNAKVGSVSASTVFQQYRAALSSLYTNVKRPERDGRDKSVALLYQGSITPDLVGPNSPWIRPESEVARGNYARRPDKITPVRFVEAGPMNLVIYHQRDAQVEATAGAPQAGAR